MAVFSKLKNLRIIFLVLTLLCGIFLLAPTLDFQAFLSQGDHGRDLYAFERTMKGDTPYQDYWWVYGPLMPLYYSFFDRWLGTNIQSIRFGEMLLKLATGLLVYLTLVVFFDPIIAFLGAVWFLVFGADFFFTYNHTGGILCLVWIAWCLFLYLKAPRIRYLMRGLIGIFLLSLIKINFGISSWLIFLFLVWLIDTILKNPKTPEKKYFYILALGTLVAVFLIYGFLVKGLTSYEIRQCFPYMKGDQPFETSIGKAIQFLGTLTLHSIRSSWANIIFAGLVLLGLGQMLYMIVLKKWPKDLRDRICLGMTIILVFLVVSLQEFLVSGVHYRSLWARPFQTMSLFALLGAASLSLSRLTKGMLWAALLLVVILESTAQVTFVQKFKVPYRYLDQPKAKVFVGNELRWIRTVRKTTGYLSSHLKENETFFALPYDCLYYYLTDKQSPTRQLIFFDHIKIPPEQERKVIEELEQKRVGFVLLSNRMGSAEPGLGVFGQTYCPVLARYIQDHFRIVAVFGDWKNQPGWAWNHGTMILKRSSHK